MNKLVKSAFNNNDNRKGIIYKSYVYRCNKKFLNKNKSIERGSDRGSK